MKKIIIVMAIFVFGTVLSSTPNLRKDKLIQKAIKIAEDNWNLVPGIREKTEIIRNSGGSIKKKETLKMKYSYNTEENKILNEIVGYYLNDKKMEISKDKNEFKEELEEDLTPNRDTFFLNSLKNNPELAPLREFKIIDGRKCYVYRFKYESKLKERKVIQKGKLYLDSENGTLLRREMQFDPLPKFVEEMQIVVDYFHKDGIWAVKELDVKIDLKVAFFFRKSIERHTKFSNYWEYEKTRN